MATWYESKSDSTKTYKYNEKKIKEKRKAESRYPGRRIGFSDGVLVFLDTGRLVPGSPTIEEPSKAKVTDEWIY